MRKFTWFLCALLFAVAVAPLVAQTTTPDPLADFSTTVALLTGAGSAALIGLVKTLEQKADVAIVSKLGNLTPILVVALNLALPKVWPMLHLSGTIPNATIVATAPVGVAVSLLAREAYQWIAGRFHLPPTPPVA